MIQVLLSPVFKEKKVKVLIFDPMLQAKYHFLSDLVLNSLLFFFQILSLFLARVCPICRVDVEAAAAQFRTDWTG